jgi:phage terminase large subunit GpA-like protein
LGEPGKAAYFCEHCVQAISNHQKSWMLPRGEWRASAEGDGRTRGYHLSSLYSPVGWYSWERAADDWEKAQRDVELLKSFVNLVLGESWQQRGDAPDWLPLYDRREEYRIGTVPNGVLFLTAGVDVQRDRIEVEIVGWGRNKESWSVDYIVLPGDTAEPAIWRQLDAILDREFPQASGRGIPIRVMCVDAGYNPEVVYDWVRRHPQASWGAASEAAGSAAPYPKTAVAVKGTGATDRLLVRPTVIDGGSRRWGVRLWLLGTPVAKQQLYNWLRLRKPPNESDESYPAGFCHFPRYDEEYFRQLTSESAVEGRWEPLPNRRNEVLDARVYARAAAAIFGMDRFTEDDWRVLERNLAPATDDAGDSPARRVVRSRFLER